MDLERVCRLLKNEFIWVFCDTCKNDGKNCHQCSKDLMKQINWELSDDAALEIGLKIRDIIKEEEEVAE